VHQYLLICPLLFKNTGASSVKLIQSDALDDKKSDPNRSPHHPDVGPKQTIILSARQISYTVTAATKADIMVAIHMAPEKAGA
jgi:hypothetical protein